MSRIPVRVAVTQSQLEPHPLLLVSSSHQATKDIFNCFRSACHVAVLVAEYCRTTKLDATGAPKITADVCTSTKVCPYVPAGQACRSAAAGAANLLLLSAGSTSFTGHIIGLNRVLCRQVQ